MTLIHKASYKTKASNAGFTLVEVMVALAIIGVALGAAVQAVSVANHNAANLSQQTFARWVAMNQIVRVQTSGQWLDLGKSDGTEEMANATWHWQMDVVETEDDGLRQLQVSAGLSPDVMQVTMIAYLHNRTQASAEAGIGSTNANDQLNAP